ncbi:MAG: CPBP family intramembrane metalloprotease [Candidatus Krumholzibacteriota bacterium]|nr:CPBP family intramembrane metalloprotease [Candidatus Krumholzibacteriota bacterium]
MYRSDRLGARVNNWLLLLIGGLSFLLYEFLQAPFYDLATAWVGLGIILSAVAGVVMPFLILCQRLGIPFRVQFQFERPRVLAGLAVTAATLCLIPPLEILTAWVGAYYPPDPVYLEFMASLRGESWWDFGVVAVAVVGAVALAEELIFRGMFFRVLLRHTPGAVTVVLTALLFAIVHPLYAVPGVVVLGLFFGLLMLRLQNLTYPILAHAVWNLANLVVLKSTENALDPEMTTPFSEHAVLWTLGSAAAFALCGWIWWRAGEEDAFA